MEITQVKELIEALENKFAQDVQVMDISEISSLGDYFILATGKNDSQIDAMAGAAQEYLHQQGIQLKNTEGRGNTGWVLLDFGIIIVHLFNEEQRGFYKLDSLWADAKLIEL